MRKRAVASVTLAMTLVFGLAGPGRTAEPDPLATPTGPVVLTVDGAISHTNHADRFEFDMAMLEALGTRSVRTRLPWLDGVTAFEGVSMRTLMDHVGATGTEVVAQALNDYKATIPLSDFTDHDVLLAFRQEEKRLSVRDKGPLWIVYPLAADAVGHDVEARVRMVWQLTRLTVQ